MYCDFKHVYCLCGLKDDKKTLIKQEDSNLKMLEWFIHEYNKELSQ